LNCEIIAFTPESVRNVKKFLFPLTFLVLLFYSSFVWVCVSAFCYHLFVPISLTNTEMLKYKYTHTQNVCVERRGVSSISRLKRCYTEKVHLKINKNVIRLLNFHLDGHFQLHNFYFLILAAIRRSILMMLTWWNFSSFVYFILFHFTLCVSFFSCVVKWQQWTCRKKIIKKDNFLWDGDGKYSSNIEKSNYWNFVDLKTN
jgi:hypothetical protein